ncbi:MAG: matrixin family metalloprotease, partial [Nitrososphaera sp.]|nr:matrixin family metalloprotease [Nitrososphaera sp.]
MANPKKAIAISAAAAGGSLLLVAFVLNSLVATGMVIRDIETSEHADEVLTVSQAPEGTPGPQVLNLNGYWKKSVVTVSFIPQGISQQELEQMVVVLEETMQTRTDGSSSNSTSTFIGWPDLLASLSSSYNMPSLQVIERDSETADIRIYLEEESHPDNKLGLARIARDKATHEIVYSEVHIYSVRELHQDGILGHVFKHELGHALGIGHGTSETSIMHSPIIIVNSTAIGNIGYCEAEG